MLSPKIATGNSRVGELPPGYEPEDAAASSEEDRRPVVESAYDAIVIGTGIGGMTAAALLARRKGWRVLMLEQHFTAGGQTHEFRRKRKFEFDVGLHYLGQLAPGSQARAVFDYLTDGKLDWQPMTHQFERFFYPGLEFRVPADKAEYRKRLISLFPEQAAGIRRYFRDLGRASQGYVMAHLHDVMPGWVRHPVRWLTARRTRLASMTTQAYLERHFRDAKLKALLTSQWGDYGLPPSESMFGAHALIVHHYLNGGWYPVGGAKAIAQHILPAVRGAGGRVLTGRRVAEILLEGGRAVGVRVTRTYRPDMAEEIYRAPVVISDAGVGNTYLRLLPAETPVPFRKELETQRPGISAVTLYLGLKESPAKVGIQGENCWMFDSFDHEAMASGRELGAGTYLSFPSLKNPLAKTHTAEIIAFMPYAVFARWKGETWRKRGDAYEALKKEIAGTLIQKAEQRIPGLAALIEFQELATPLTLEHFLANPGGEFYGMPLRPGRLFAAWTRAESPVPGLYLTGQDVMSPGVMGAMMGGAKCAGLLEGGLGFFKLMGHIRAKAARRAKTRDGPAS